jgi:hypothetical protein
MAKQKLSTWDAIQNHQIAGKLEADAQLALLCEYIDLLPDLQDMTLSDYIDGYFASDEQVETQAEELDQAEADEDMEPAPSSNGKVTKDKPQSLIGARVVYRFPGRNVLSDEAGVTRDSGGTVAFVDVDGESWSNVARAHIHPIADDAYLTLHITPREAKEINGWLSGKPVKNQPEGALLRSMTLEFPDHPDKIAFAVMNGKKPYVDRFVGLPDNGFEDDQKPVTRLFGDHCFRVRGKDYVVTVVTP